MKKDRFIAIRNQASGDTLELFFLDVIADTYDWYTGYTSKVQEIIDKINFYKPTKIKVIIDSVGGDAQVGMSIYNFLKRCEAKIEVEIIGLAGSIASVIAMAANKGKLRIAKNAFMMIHKAEGGCYGNSDEMRQAADVVDLYTSQIVDIYSQRTGKSVDEINALIAAGDYWMTGDDCVTQGFADETFNGVENVQIAARLDTSIYKNIPAQVRAQMTNSGQTQEHDTKSFIQTQLDDMKKFFTDIVNAIRGVKPEEGKQVTNQIAEAVTAPFEKLADEIESTITNTVNTVVAGKTVNDAIALQVTNAVNAVDFSAGAPNTAVTNAAVVAVTNALKADGENEVKTLITNLINAAVTAKTKDIETEITNMKGNKTEGGNGNENAPAPIGKFS
jgi:ATP-dependent protease ClpP protease subunit